MQFTEQKTNDLLQPWKPSESEPWNTRRVWHLHRRAGFGATWSELQRDLRDGVDASVTRFLQGKARVDGVPDDFENIVKVIGNVARSSRQISQLKAWWVYRMLFSPDPLSERLTLMWHNHFATSFEKVRVVRMMWQQNQKIRTHCLGKFNHLLSAVIKDPAMLVWLDAAANRRTHPNENLARELLELFTLGEGHYTEADVKQTARCLTGLRVHGGQFKFTPEHFDRGDKKILGKDRDFNCDELLAFLATHPETAKRIAWRLCDTFLGENVAQKKHIEQLARLLIKNKFDIRSAIKTLLRSKLFFSDANLKSQITGPCDLAISTFRALELFDHSPDTITIAWQIDKMGQRLFEPTNVFGWKGGRAWINTRSLVSRRHFVNATFAGKLQRSKHKIDVGKIVSRNKIDPAKTSEFFWQLLTGTVPERFERFELKHAQNTVPEILASTHAQLQ